ncbi:MAG: GDP-mannose 4,6-dehydratase [Coraliomargaritaceae bacterium]
MNILLTGCAGFIGSHTLEKLISDGHRIVGVDNFDPFYSRTVKNQNLANISSANFELIEGDLADLETYSKINFINGENSFDAIIHLAAKAGVRPSIEDPLGYQRANVIATQNLLEFAKEHSIKQFVFASSSSVYGVNPNVPWKEDGAVLKPISPYASTKVSCELMGHVYSELFGIRFLGLRFFTVYGPRQRPDLAINKFMNLIRDGKPIPVFGDGSTRRDYTYIDDIVSGIMGALHYDLSNYEIFNLGNDQTVTLSGMIETIESVIRKKAIIDRQPEQPGDVPQTWADIRKARDLLNFNPKTSFQEGIVLYANSRAI